MAKMSVSDAIMPPDKMRPLLALSKKEPVQAAIALAATGEALLLLDKKAAPRKVMSMLKTQADTAKLKLNATSMRFGRAEVDVDYDPGIVRFFVNKDVPGALHLKISELIKRIPYQKAEFQVDPSLEQDMAGESAAPQTPAAATPEPDAASLTQQLRELMGRVQQQTSAGPAHTAELTKMVMQVGTDIKAGVLDAAVTALARLRATLDTPPTQDASLGGLEGSVTYGKARLAWLSTLRSISSDLERLAVAVRADYADEGLGDTIEQEFRAKVEPIMAHFDESLADTLDAAINQTDAGKRAKLVAEARQTVERYQNYLASERLIALLDENPYQPLTIVSTLTKTLSALSAAIR